MKLSEKAKELIGEIHPALVATADKTGKPNVSAKGSLRVLDSEHLLFADIASPRTIKNIRENPQVAVICLNATERKGCRIWGNAEVLVSGPLFLEAAKEFAHKNMTVKNVVKIAVMGFETF